MGFFQGTQEPVETAVVNQPSVFQPLKFYCRFTSVGRIDLLQKETIENPKLIKTQISKTLSDLYIQEWDTKVISSSKGKTYSIFKNDINFENYLIKLNKKHWSTLLKFRLSNHRLPVETGRRDNIPLEERKCNLCEKNDIGDEFHYLFVCSHFNSDRKQFLKPYFYKRPNMIKFKELPYLPYIFGRIKIIIFFTVRTFNLEKNYNFFSVRIFTNAEKLPIIEGIHRYICGNFSVYTDRCENKQFSLTLCCFIN